MTSFEVSPLTFSEGGIAGWGPIDPRHVNWPVVYVLDDMASTTGRRREPEQSVYVGETRNAVGRLRQHLSSSERGHLTDARVILDPTFNKSVCLDLESFLIRMFAGDGTYSVLNRNDGIVDADYFDRGRYQETFRSVFDALKRDGLFTRTIPEIENSDLFKLSPFKALTNDQTTVVVDIIEGLLDDLENHTARTAVVQGDPGTGKTIVAIYLLKMLVDIAGAAETEDLDNDSVFTDFFKVGNRELLHGKRFGFVIPQQSLRRSVRRVFARTPGLSADMVLTPFEVGEAEHDFDVLVVDETHRLNQRANQPSGVQNKRFREITQRLFGYDDVSKTQLDWIKAKSSTQILLLDAAQSVRPADLPPAALVELVETARTSNSYYGLFSQMRVRAGSDYVRFIRSLLAPAGLESEDGPATSVDLGEYDLRLFDDLETMRSAIATRDREHGLARLVAGYAWEWRSRKDRDAYDIEIDSVRLRWNSEQVDWIASAKSAQEVGSIHTVQGYDLNYAGVIIGPDLRLDPESGRLVVDRKSYFDKKGMENNPVLGLVYDDEALLRFITNIYAVLLTRGIRGTYVYVCDPNLREYLRQYLPHDERV